MDELFNEARAAVYAVWHRRWIALGIAWAMCLLGWLVIAVIPNSYESKARIYVDVDDVLSKQLGIAGDGQQEIMRVRQTLASAKNLEKVITATRLGEGIAARSELNTAIAELEKKVKVTSEQDNLFEITATIGKRELSEAENAMLARDVVQKLLDIFRDEHISGNRAGISQAISDLDRQLDERKLELESAEQRRLAFEAEYPDMIGGSETLSSKVAQERAELRSVDADLAAAQSALAALKGQLSGTPRTISDGGNPYGARGALSQAQTQLAELRGRGLTDEHPDVIAATRQVQLLTRQVAADPKDSGGTPNPAFTSLQAIMVERQATVDSLQARRAALQSNFAGLMASQASEPAVAAEANRISRDYDVLRQNYEKLLQDREELRTRGKVEDKASQFRFDLIDPPTVPQKPAAPNRLMLLLGVLIMGLGAGAAGAYLLGLLRSTFATPNKLERAFDLPVIGAISFTISDAARTLEKKRFKQFAAGTAGLLGVFFILAVIEIITVSTVA
jgi:polysaccharide chain length determinant protein (PEP-CTERM system associated)